SFEEGKGLVACCHLFRKRRPQLRGHEIGEPNPDQKEGKELTAGESADESRIRFAEIFHDDSKNCIADQEQASENPVRWPQPRAHKPKDGEQNNSFEKSFVKL